LEGTTGKVGFFFEMLFGGLAALHFAALIVFVLTFVHQHHRTWAQPWMGPQIEQMTSLLPPITYSLWIVILVLDIYFCLTAFRLRNKFAERETRTRD
jgi:hypothetical protein